MKLFSDVDSDYMTKADYKHLSRHNQTAPYPYALFIVSAATLALLLWVAL